MLVCMITLFKVVQCSWDIYNRPEIQLPSLPNKSSDNGSWIEILKTVYNDGLKPIGDKAVNIVTVVKNVYDILKSIVWGLAGLFALAAMTVLLWILSIWHKIISRCYIARQAEEASQRIIGHLLKEINLRKEKLLRDSDLAEK